MQNPTQVRSKIGCKSPQLFKEKKGQVCFLGSLNEFQWNFLTTIGQKK
jgi:hypothetical protein